MKDISRHASAMPSTGVGPPALGPRRAPRAGAVRIIRGSTQPFDSGLSPILKGCHASGMQAQTISDIFTAAPGKRLAPTGVDRVVPRRAARAGAVRLIGASTQPFDSGVLPILEDCRTSVMQAQTISDIITAAPGKRPASTGVDPLFPGAQPAREFFA